VDGGDCEWCRVRAASLAGVRHRLAGQAGQDSFAWALEGSRLAVAVCDGLGSIEGSAEAAERTARAAAAAAAHEGPAAKVIASAVEAANDAAAKGGATTLVLAVIDDDGGVELVRVGDSSAIVVDPDGTWSEAFAGGDGDASGERMHTETAALPAEEPAAERATLSLHDGRVLALLTDGVADPWRDGPTTVAAQLSTVLASDPSPMELARWVGFSRQGCHDDRTVVAVWLSSRPEGSPEPLG
jgi:serine/threonine protein phosphatase PrpC